MYNNVDLRHGHSDVVYPHFGRQRSRGDSVSSRGRSYSLDEVRSKQPRTDGNIKYLSVIDCQSEVLCCKFYPDGSLFAAGLANGLIKIFKTDSYACIYELSDNDIRNKGLPCTSIQFIVTVDDDRRKYQLIATYASGLVKHWHFTTSSVLHTTDESRQTLCSSIHLTQERYVTAGADGKLHVYNMETKQKMISHAPSDSRDVMNGHRQRVLATQYHPTNSNLLISGGWDDTVQFWDDRQEHAVKRIYGPHICGEGLDIDPTHNHLMTGSWRKGNELQIWDVNTGTKLKDIPQDVFHQCMLYCCQWLNQEYVICGGNEQNMMRIIDRGTLNTVAQLIDLEAGVFCIDHDRTSNHPKIILGSAQSVHVLKQEKRV